MKRILELAIIALLAKPMSATTYQMPPKQFDVYIGDSILQAKRKEFKFEQEHDPVKADEKYKASRLNVVADDIKSHQKSDEESEDDWLNSSDGSVQEMLEAGQKKAGVFEPLIGGNQLQKGFLRQARAEKLKTFSGFLSHVCDVLIVDTVKTWHIWGTRFFGSKKAAKELRNSYVSSKIRRDAKYLGYNKSSIGASVVVAVAAVTAVAAAVKAVSAGLPFLQVMAPFFGAAAGAAPAIGAAFGACYLLAPYLGKYAFAIGAIVFLLVYFGWYTYVVKRIINYFTKKKKKEELRKKAALQRNKTLKQRLKETAKDVSNNLKEEDEGIAKPKPKKKKETPSWLKTTAKVAAAVAAVVFILYRTHRNRNSGELLDAIQRKKELKRQRQLAQELHGNGQVNNEEVELVYGNDDYEDEQLMEERTHAEDYLQTAEEAKKKAEFQHETEMIKQQAKATMSEVNVVQIETEVMRNKLDQEEEFQLMEDKKKLDPNNIDPEDFIRNVDSLDLGYNSNDQ